MGIFGTIMGIFASKMLNLRIGTILRVLKWVLMGITHFKMGINRVFWVH